MNPVQLLWLVSLPFLTYTESAQEESAYLINLSLEDLLEIDVSSASKSSMKADDAPGIVSVITREDIRNLGAETLEDVLNLIPGLTVGRSLQNGLHNTLYVRGSFSLFAETVLILHNGQRLNDPVTGGGLSFSPDFPLSYVKQVEIIRGPGSALYGANAFSALINIITDETNREGFEGGFQGGTGNGADVSAFYGRRLTENIHLSMRVNIHQHEQEDIPVQPFTEYETDNPPPFDIGIPFNTRFENAVTADLAESSIFGLALKANNLELRLDYETIDAEANWGSGVQFEPVGSIDFTDDQFRHRSESEIFRFSALYSKDLSQSLTIRSAITYNDFQQSGRYAWASFAHIKPVAGDGAEAAIISPRDADTRGGEVTLEWRPKDGQLLVAGYSFQEDDVKDQLGLGNTGQIEQGVIVGVQPFAPNGDFIKGDSRKVHAFYAQYSWEVNDQFAITGGIRDDDYSDFGNTVNPRLAMVYKASDKLNIKALYGQAFRAPTFLETNNFVSGEVIPNPELQPEEIKTVEVQLNYRPMRTLKTALSVYSYEVDDVIRQVPTLNPEALFETQARNTGTREGEGLEFEIRYQPDIYKMAFLNYSLVDATDVSGDGRRAVEAIPEQSLNFGFVYDFGGDWVIGLSGHYRGSWISEEAIALPDINVPGFGDVSENLLNRIDFPSYTMINANIQWRDILKGGDLLFEVENILDDQQIFGDQHNFAPGGISIGERVFKVGFQYKL